MNACMNRGQVKTFDACPAAVQFPIAQTGSGAFGLQLLAFWRKKFVAAQAATRLASELGCCELNGNLAPTLVYTKGARCGSTAPGALEASLSTGSRNPFQRFTGFA